MKIYKRPLKFVWDSFKGHKKMFYIFFAWKVIEWLFYVFVPILAKIEMDQLVEKNEQLFWIITLNSFNIFLVILLIIFFIKLIENILLSLLQHFQFDYIKIYDNFYIQGLYKRLEWVEPWIFLNSRNKRFIWDIFWNSNVIWDYIRILIWGLITYTFVIIWITTVLAFINIWIFLVLIIAWIIIYFIEKIKQKYLNKESFEDKYDFYDKIKILSEQMQDNLSYLMASWWFLKVLWYYNKANERLRKKIKTIQMKMITLNIFFFLIENVSEIFVKLIVWYSIFFATGSIWIMTMVMLYVWRINNLMYFVRSFRFFIDRVIDSLLKLNIFLNLTEVTEKKRKNIKSFNKIEFKNVTFSYPNFAKKELEFLIIIENRIKAYSKNNNEYEKDQLHLIEETKKEAEQKSPIILNKINLNFEIWKTYWIVGKNWAWKTTIISLLMNYFNDYSWNILINDKELKNTKKDFFIKNISVINQVPYIIDWFSIRENLLLWVEKKYSEEDILQLLDKFWLKKKVLKNRKGLDSKIWYDNDFSGWEKQLIALIRVILQDKKILIMDEGTNQLDAENEVLIMNELLKHRKDKIVIFITHRMTTIRKVDLIYCLENWKITDSWNHHNLVKWKNIYNSFWKKQVEE